MDSLKRYIPDGARDILFEECSVKIEVTDKLRKLYLSRGFMEIMSPTLEYYDVFYNDNTLICQENMYKLFDNKGRILVLKPDMTIPIARIASTRLKDIEGTLRICYSGNIYRINENFNGKNNEITQSGIEILGVDSKKADLEVITTAIEALHILGIEGFRIELGHMDFFKGLVEDTYLSREEAEILKIFVENKNFTALREYLGDREDIAGKENMNAMKNLPELFGGVEVLDKARDLTESKTALNAVDTISWICEKLKMMGLERYITIDLGMVQHLHYYTGITFRGLCSETGGYILSGGRYDNLTEHYGRSMPAVGFAADIDSIMTALERQKKDTGFKKDRILLHYNDEHISAACSLSSMLRQRGIIVEWSLYEKKEQALEYGRRARFNKICFLNDEDNLEIIDVHVNGHLYMSMNEFINSLEDNDGTA